MTHRSVRVEFLIVANVLIVEKSTERCAEVFRRRAGRVRNRVVCFIMIIAVFFFMECEILIPFYAPIYGHLFNDLLNRNRIPLFHDVLKLNPIVAL